MAIWPYNALESLWGYRNVHWNAYMPRKVVLWLLEIPKTQAQNSSIPAIYDCFTIDITSTPAASTSSITIEGVLGLSFGTVLLTSVTSITVYRLSL